MEIKINTTLRYTACLLELPNIVTLITQNTDESMKQQKLYTLLIGMQNSTANYSLAVSERTKHMLTI